MNAFMTSILGASWKTALMGFIGGVFYYFDQTGVSFPQTAADWKNAIVAAGIFAWGRLQKDSNVSNSPAPVAPAAISAKAAATPNTAT